MKSRACMTDVVARVAMSASGAHRPFVPALTGLRAFAALWVLALHMSWIVAALLPGWPSAVLTVLARPGFLGVDVFFVLSGFIISYNYAAVFDDGFDLRRWGRFLWARLARIYPVHAVILVALAIAVLGLGFGRGGEIEERRWSIGALAQSFLLIHAWTGETDVWNGVSWSISSEWLAYLCFPLLSFLAVVLTRASRLRAAWVAVFVLTALPALRQTFATSLNDIVPMPPLQILAEFLAGCVTYRLFERRARSPRVFSNPGPLLVALVAVSAGLAHWGVTAFWAVVFVPPMLLGIARHEGFLSRVLSHPAAVYWGKVSFALYMTHYLWLWIMHTFFPVQTMTAYGLVERIVFVLIHALPTFAIAAATYHLIEEPARGFFARAVARPAERPAAASGRAAWSPS
jgi:peptidoglycan/LPS O-acetylase OafA/YrhL